MPSASPDPQLRILLLGPPAVFAGERPHTVQRRALRQMLYYLAAHPGPISRARLVALFWPDEGEEMGRKRLREALSRLRHELPSPDLLITFQDQVSLDPARVYVDVREFQALNDQTARAVMLHTGRPLPEVVFQQLVKAARLWRSPRFLAGATFDHSSELDEWMLNTGRALELSLQNIQVRLAEHLALRGDLSSALQWLLRAVELDPFNDDYHARVLRWMRDLGRRGEARRYYQDLAGRYRDEGMPLSARLVELGQQLQQNGLPETAVPAFTPGATLRLPLVGRDILLQHLRQAYLRGGLQVIEGEAGSGKSRLAAELFQALEPGPRLLLAVCHPSERHMPAQPLADLLRQSVSPAEWQRLEPLWAGALASLLPELRQLRPDLGGEPGPDIRLERQLFYEALRQLLFQLAEPQRLLFILDNAQWADEETRGALQYLLNRGFFRQHGLLLMLARTGECGMAGRLPLGGAHTGTPQERVYLEPLDKAAVGELARMVLGREAPDSFTEQLLADSGGNPFYVLETLRVMVELSQHSDSTPEQWAGPLPLPASVHTLCRERLSGLPPLDRQTLTAAAMLGTVFSQPVLEAAVSLGPEELTQALENLERCRLIRPAGGQEWAFVHGKTRAVLLQDLSQARKRQMHLQVARALEISGGPEPEAARELANHYKAAGQLVSAYHHWLRYAEDCVERLEHTAAYEAFQRAESLLLRLGPRLPDQEVYRLYRRWGLCACDGEDIESAERCFQMMLRSGRERHSSLLIGGGLNGLARVHLQEGQVELGLERSAQSYRLLEHAGYTAEQVEWFNIQAGLRMYQRRLEEADHLLEEALAASEGAVAELDWEARVHALALKGRLLSLGGYPEKAYAVGREALSSAYRLRRPIQIAVVRQYLCVSALQSGHYRDALEQARLGQEVARRAKTGRLGSALLGLGATAAFLLGNLDEAWLNAQTGLQLSTMQGHMDTAALAHGVMGDILRALGDLDGAVELYRLGVSEDLESRGAWLENQYRLGRALAEKGYLEDGLALMEQALQALNRPGAWLLAQPEPMARAWMALVRGDAARALELAGQACRDSAGRGLPLLEPWRDWMAGVLALREGNPAAAAEKAAAVDEAARRLGHFWLRFDAARLNYRAVLAAGGDAAPAYDRMVDLLEGLRAETHSPEMSARLQRYIRNRQWEEL